MPKTKTTRGKKYTPRYVYRYPAEERWRTLCIDNINVLEGRLLLHLHTGEADFDDVLRMRDFALAALFIMVHRPEQFAEIDVEAWIVELNKTARHLDDVAKRSLDKSKRVVCTGDELRAINASMGPVLDFLRENLKTAPRATALEIYASALLRHEMGKKVGRDTTFSVDYKKVEHYYQRASSTLLRGPRLGLER